ncbi:MAG: hypothetical protein ACK53Y_22535, partial [bacterium]
IDVYDPEPIPASYNIPQEYLSQQPSKPITPPVVTEDKIKNSKLPDAIKELIVPFHMFPSKYHVHCKCC